jgi:hypothetical protein
MIFRPRKIMICDSTARASATGRFGMSSRGLGLRWQIVTAATGASKICSPAWGSLRDSTSAKACLLRSLAWAHPVALLPPIQVTLTSVYVPYTVRSASQISPTVAYTRTASTMYGIVFAEEIPPLADDPGS